MSDHSPATSWSHVTGIVVGLTGVLAVLLVAFAWPPSQLAPRHLPIAVAGPPGAAGQVTAALGGQAGRDAFDVTAVDSPGAAVEAIESRQVYGAVVLSPAGPEMLVASAASPVVAQLLTEAGTHMAGATGTAPSVSDVAPLPGPDPHGAVFAAGAFPLAVGGIAVGVALALRVPGRGRRMTAAVGVAAASGLALAAVQQLWLGALEGSYWANAGVYALAIGAMAAVVMGLHRVLGIAGLASAAVTIVVLGNPLSAIASAPELLPEGWGALGQLLPPGAAGSALRSTAYFAGAGVTTPLLVLGGWLLVGSILLAWPVRGAAEQAATSPEGRLARPSYGAREA